MKKNFKEFYDNLKEIVDTTKLDKRPSKSGKNKNLVKVYLTGANDKSIKVNCIEFPENNTTRSDAQGAYLDLVIYLCKNENIYKKFIDNKWLYEKNELPNTDRYGEIGEGYFLFKNANVEVLLVRAVKAVLETLGEEKLQDFVFHYEIDEKSDGNLDEEDIEAEFVEKFSLEEAVKNLDKDFAKRYITSLLAKPFVILTGNSGTGKTRIAKQFAEYLEVHTADGEKNWILIPVGADWTDNTKVLGYYNPFGNEGKGEFKKTEILKLIERANDHEDIPYFIILDEMNLSHVERYFSDFLSIMETVGEEFKLDGYVDEHGKSKSLRYTNNIFITGTVNIDETTYMFSPKVLDRANVIEFAPAKNSVMSLFSPPKQDEPPKNDSDTASSDLDEAGIDKKAIAKAFLNLSSNIRLEICDKDDIDFEYVKKTFDSIYDILAKEGFEFAYRTVKEIRRYIIASYELETNKEEFDLTNVMDEQVLQKILPKIHGNKREIGTMLKELSKICGVQKENQKESQEEKPEFKLPKSAKK